jgi:DNA invertase Pin-like site-specific DNA recombinase
MIYGYARVSTDAQDLSNQVAQLNPSSRIGGFLRDPLVVDQRFSVKGLHYIG